MDTRERLHAVVFMDPARAVEAAGSLRRDGFAVIDAHTPFAVHGMDEALGYKPTKLPYATLTGGIIGLTIALSFQLWSHHVNWPLSIGGKDTIAWPSMIPVGFELTVLLAAFGTIGTLLLASRLRPRFAGGLPTMQPGVRVTDDQFVLVVSEHDGSFDARRLRKLSHELGALEVREGWRVR